MCAAPLNPFGQAAQSGDCVGRNFSVGWAHWVFLRAYKLTGIFHVNLEIVPKDLAAFDKVTYEIEPESQLLFTQTADMLCSGLTGTFTSKGSTKSCGP
jgi:hypothetical protein